ncbi:thiamine phosphate synthase [Mesorhizobium sp. GR13]|uniref:thiamine phosphate synthase n=1 Tax=Mesorhizobium sp. GR13 TaxID=2562308 RepID=UPI0010BF893D|nr:thiamine phosphate synthase [Mesorhizobium sp. GR13]
MTDMTIPNRCRLVLILPHEADTARLAQKLEAALSGGDVASVILPDYGMDDASFQRHAAQLVPVAQAVGAAIILSGDTRIAARLGADGVHIEGGREVLDDAIDRLQDKMAVGAGGAKTRDDALDLGEARPDYIFFGRFGYDTKPEPHNRNLTLGKWWAEMIEIPCVVMGGSEVESVRTVGETGVEFVALSQAVFGAADPAAAVAAANALLDEHAPSFGEVA